MSDSTHASEPSSESRRVPLEREVVLEFEHFSNFIREYSSNISLGGMFVRTKEKRLPGTVFRFEVRLTDDAPLVSGLAKVLWVRERDEGEDRPAGMGVRFLKLESEGRRLIERIVSEHLARGGRPFDLEDAAPEPAAPPAEEASAAEEAPAAAEGRQQPEPDEPSTVIELPPLEELLRKSESLSQPPAMDTPPRGWKPGIFAVRPQTRPQLLITIAVLAVMITVIGFFLMRRFAGPPVLESSEIEPPPLPRAEVTAEPAVPQEEPPGPRFTALEQVRWQRQGSAAEVIVRVNGTLVEGSWSESRMTDPPRHVLKLLGATEPYPTETIEVGFGGVRQLRTGYHTLTTGDEQHVVIDLIDPRVVLERVETDGGTLRLLFRRISP